MKTIQEVIDNYEDYQTLIEDRFGYRFAGWLEIEQLERIGFSIKDDAVWKPKDWTEASVLNQLHDDVKFGLQKANDERGISSALMYDVVKAWCRVLENGLEDFDEYEPYGKPLFCAVIQTYGWTDLLKSREES